MEIGASDLYLKHNVDFSVRLGFLDKCFRKSETAAING
jgi:hypothetical protein